MMKNKKRKFRDLQIAGIICARCNKNEYLLMNIDNMLWTICKQCGLASPMFAINFSKKFDDHKDCVEKKTNSGVH